jgi:hypothetical protein
MKSRAPARLFYFASDRNAPRRRRAFRDACIVRFLSQIRQRNSIRMKTSSNACGEENESYQSRSRPWAAEPQCLRSAQAVQQRSRPWAAEPQCLRSAQAVEQRNGLLENHLRWAVQLVMESGYRMPQHSTQVECSRTGTKWKASRKCSWKYSLMILATSPFPVAVFCIGLSVRISARQAHHISRIFAERERASHCVFRPLRRSNPVLLPARCGA